MPLFSFFWIDGKKKVKHTESSIVKVCCILDSFSDGGHGFPPASIYAGFLMPSFYHSSDTPFYLFISHEESVSFFSFFSFAMLIFDDFGVVLGDVGEIVMG